MTYLFNKEQSKELDRQSKDLENWKNNLAMQKDAAALRDYQYDARKRLYQEFEPLLFKLVECCESAYVRIWELARAARLGQLEPEEGSLKDNQYYKISTIYRFLLPLAVFRLMQEQLTLFDLDLVPFYKLEYELAKGLYFSFAYDFNFANSEPRLQYNPPDDASKEDYKPKIKSNPEIFRRQGLYRGLIDNLADALIKKESNEKPHIICYGEFNSKYLDMNETFQAISDLFHNFHPRSCPILWRILIAQAHFYKAIIYTRKMKHVPIDIFKPLKTISVTERAQYFDWRKNKEEAIDDEVLVYPFTAIENYLRDPTRGYSELICKRLE